MSHIPDPYSGYSNISPGGIQYAVDQNPPPPPTSAADPVVRPEFLEHCIEELVAVRNEISQLWADQYGQTSGNKVGKPEQLTVAGYERDRLNRAKRQKLEQRENDLMAKIKGFTDVASLGDAAVIDENTYASEKL